MNRHCEACGVEVHPALGECPLCGAPLPSAEGQEEESVHLPYPSRARKIAAPSGWGRLALLFERLAPWAAAFLVALNLLTRSPFPWSLYPAGAILALAALLRGLRSLRSPRASYAILLVEGLSLAFIGLVAFLGPTQAWYFQYLLPSVALGGGAALGLSTAKSRRPLKKTYAPLLIQAVLGALSYPLARLSGGAPDAIFGGIVSFASIAAFALVAKSARRWWKSEAKRKLLL
jgi:hypothetical protein